MSLLGEQMGAVRGIALRAGVTDEDFETAMREQILPSVPLPTRRDIQGAMHSLSKSDDTIDGRRLYLWAILVQLVGEGEWRVWPMDDAADEGGRDALPQIEAYGTLVVFRPVASGTAVPQ